MFLSEYSIIILLFSFLVFHHRAHSSNDEISLLSLIKCHCYWHRLIELMLIFQGLPIYVKFSAGAFLILQKKYAHFWASVIYWTDINMIFYIFILTVGHSMYKQYYIFWIYFLNLWICTFAVIRLYNEEDVFLFVCLINTQPVSQSFVSEKDGKLTSWTAVNLCFWKPITASSFGAHIITQCLTLTVMSYFLFPVCILYTWELTLHLWVFVLCQVSSKVSLCC